MTAVRTAPSKGPELAERYHLEGCPSERIERYPAGKPRKVVDENGNVAVAQRTVIVTRCVDCGGERVTDPPTTVAATAVEVDRKGEG